MVKKLSGFKINCDHYIDEVSEESTAEDVASTMDHNSAENETEVCGEDELGTLPPTRPVTPSPQRRSPTPPTRPTTPTGEAEDDPTPEAADERALAFQKLMKERNSLVRYLCLAFGALITAWILHI